MSTAVADDLELPSFSRMRERIPSIDGHTSRRLFFRLSGAAELDAMSGDDLALLEAARLGEPVRLIVTGEIAGKGFHLAKTRGEDELSYSCVVRVVSVEAGEAA
jgi:hypothetical protein